MPNDSNTVREEDKLARASVDLRPRGELEISEV